MHRLISRPPAILQPAFVLMRGLSRRLGLRLGVLSQVLANVHPAQRPPISQALERELQDYFAADIAQLEMLIGQPLDMWHSTFQPERLPLSAD
jgi:hypothetical protein